MVKIGLEIHGYLVTKQKLFCRCSSNYKGTEIPNTNICPICTGYPGAKPMLPNAEAFRKIVAIALILNCKVNSRNLIWQRKHYDWPDLPKGYQDTISGSYSIPVGYNGNFLGIRIREVHLEEDPAAWNPETGYIDYNRSGLPLVEIVTEPDFTSAKQVREWLKQLIITLAYIKVLHKDAGIKADVNISTYGERVEIKNVNSINNIVKAIEYEIARQEAEVKQGKIIKRETRSFDEKKKVTLVMREKEQEVDYRFIPDPDLPVISFKKEMIEEIKKQLPEMPHLKVERFIKEHNIDKDTAKILTTNREIAEFFEKVLEYNINKKLASYWVRTELLRILNWNKKELHEVNIKPKHFAELLKLISEKKITETAAKKILNEFIPNSFSPYEKIKQLEIITDASEIRQLCLKVIKENDRAVNDYRNGEEKALNFLIGKVMAITKGRADTKLVREILTKLLN